MPSEIAEKPRSAPVKQFAVFADNRVGRLNELLQRLAGGGIHVLAFSQLDSTECSIIRFITDYHDDARQLLQKNGYAFTETEVIAVEITTEADFKFVTAALVEAEINIHYIYPFIMRPNGRSALALNLEDNELAAQVLGAHGLRVLDQNDIAR